MSKKNYLIAIDLDGTLLTDEKNISAKTNQALHLAKEQGHHVVIATGRPYRSSKRYYTELQLDTPLVNFNGAHVHHPLSHSFGEYHTPLDRQVAEEVIQLCQQFGVENIMMEILDEVYMQRADETIIRTFFDPSTQINTLPTSLHHNPTSLLIHTCNDKADQLQEELQIAHASAIQHRRWKEPWNVIEVVKKGLSKAVGLEKIAHFYQIPENQIIAFGDEDNDLEMIQFAGIGVAMGNAISELKEVADHVTLSNEEDGIAHFLEKYIL